MPKPLKFAIAAAVVLVLGLSAQTTVAAWRAEGEVDPGAVRTGALRLTVGNGETAQKDYLFNELRTENLLPGSFVQAPLTIANTGTTALDYTLSGISTGTEAASPQDKALAAAGILSIYSGVPAASCQGTQAISGRLLYSGAMDASAKFASPRELSVPGTGPSSEVLCVRLGLPAGATQNAAGGRMAPTLRFAGQQK